MSELAPICYLFAPLFVGLILHGLSIKFGWFPYLAQPVDCGKTFRGKRLFGANKTFRGFIIVGLGTALGFGIQAAVLRNFPWFMRLELIEYSVLKSIALGFAVGAAAMLSELPNSFVKRRLNIEPGRQSEGYLRVLFYFFDQVDFLLGAWLVLSVVIDVSLMRILWSLFFVFFVHQILNVAGYLLGMRSSPQ